MGNLSFISNNVKCLSEKEKIIFEINKINMDIEFYKSKSDKFNLFKDVEEANKILEINKFPNYFFGIAWGYSPSRA